MGDGVGEDPVHPLHHLLGAGQVSQTPAGHGVALGEAVDGDGPLLHPGEGADAEVILAVDDLLVDLVREDQEVVVDGQVPDLLEDRPIEDGSGGVGGGVDQDHLRLGGYGVGEGDRLELLVHLGPSHSAAGEADAWLVADPGGADEDALVALVEEGLHRREDRHLRPRDDGYQVRGDLDPVLAAELLGDRRPELRDPAGGEVVGIPPLDGADGGVADVLGGVEVGLPHPQVDDVEAGGVQPLRHRRDLHRRRLGDRGESLGYQIQSPFSRLTILTAASTARLE
ncbi:MAG: hypothetical protein A4E51_00591 [Methanosaeta sp. PtaU1.Bin055]|nr:MAG: hypothetical protein A4E51_00591 [Methanosaeta sp. PtaU1.Bin055]